MSSKTFRNLILAAVTMLGMHVVSSVVSVRAQEGPPPPNLSVTPSGETLTPEEIARSLEGPGVSIGNVTYVGDARALGVFTGGTGLLGDSFESGIVLSSGQVADAVGPNDSDSTSTGFGTPGDPDLDEIVNVPFLPETFDAAVLEFDVIPTGSQVQFKYVFASEEYNEYANSQYNNVFAFFVTRGSSESKANCAVLPDGTPASINNINGGSTGSPTDPDAHHSEFFRNNDLSDGGGAINIEADGLTTELTCTADVTPGVPNHFKLVIADSGDSVYDTWVFIKAETLSVSETVLPDTGDPDPRLGTGPIVTEFTPGGVDQTQQFTFNNLGLPEDVVLQVTQHQSLAYLTLSATVTLHTQEELGPSLYNPAEFPPGTVCVALLTDSGDRACLEVKVVDASTGVFPDAALYNGPITWELEIDKAFLIANDLLTPDVAYGMAHFEGNSTSLPENIIIAFDQGVGESDNYSDIVLTESPGDSGPILKLPADITVPATDPNPDAATVPYVVSADGVVDTTVPGFFPIYAALRPEQISCSPSGFSFPRGTTDVTCTATGDNGESTTGSFNVTVTDTTAPVLTLPNITPEATGVLTPVFYDAAQAVDPDDGPTPLICSPPSGSLFPMGVTIVTCDSQDESGNAAATYSFTVTVVDTTGPVLTLPAGLMVPAANANGAIVSYTATAADTVDGPVAAACLPPSGSLFPIGTTTVQCTATDAHGNPATGSFSVTVGCCDVKISVSPGTATRGQTVALTVSASNFSKKLIFGIVRFEYTSPCSHEVMGSFPAILLPGKKVSFTIPFKVPRNACLGTYTFTTVANFVDGSSSTHSTTLIVH